MGNELKQKLLERRNGGIAGTNRKQNRQHPMGCCRFLIYRIWIRWASSGWTEITASVSW